MSIQAAPNIPEAYRFLRNGIKHAFLLAKAHAPRRAQPADGPDYTWHCKPFSMLAVAIARDDGKSDGLARVGVSARGW